MMDARVEYQSRVIIFNNGDEAIIPREYWIYSSGRVADPEPTIPTRIRVLARIQSLKILAADPGFIEGRTGYVCLRIGIRIFSGCNPDTQLFVIYLVLWQRCTSES